MDLFETLGLGPRQPEENELYVALYSDPHDPAAGPAPGPGDGVEPAAGEEAAAAPLSEGKWWSDRLEALRARCAAWLLPHTAGYVWNKDPLQLRSSARQQPPWRRAAAAKQQQQQQRAARRGQPVAGAGGPGAARGEEEEEGCLWAVMRFGDAVDDEWWAVWLLLRMSRELQDLTVQVWDNDGQFLLIEAAYALPRWLKPETAEHRVWLRHGRLHLLPLPSAAAPDLPASPSRQQALGILRQGRYSTAAPKVQRPIDERLAGYPAAARRRQQHTARCLLPGPLAAALRAEPQLVAELVAAFYYRDADDMRAAARMRHLPPSLDCGAALVRMTRCHYAQLAQQRFAPPRGMPSHLPPGAPADGPLARAADLGLKLTVAAEILCARHAAAAAASGFSGRGGAAGGAGAGASGSSEDAGGGEAGQAGEGASGAGAGPGSGPGVLTEAALVAAHPEAWRRFKASLEARGYFDGNIAGSRRYKELLAAAMEAFLAGRAEAEAAAAEAEAGEAGAAAAAGVGGRARDPRRRLAELVMWAAAHPEEAAAAEAAGSSDAAGSASRILRTSIPIQ
ncbi:hypothetical protein HXX76_004131 [Chlamydomonas incerta]|uniref:Uncharacterized protein n=1 Tax=Chlamydomonas incerta TaxID=51695 RepID=A0A835TGP9_CHLIN|nr:hypothetical protein HXX76_004131 [Chlamydomonas incerta]|eukprot:KAG2440014.1 hypothetical protein HXX76_004131 [Chlamydomonas incerta]